MLRYGVFFGQFVKLSGTGRRPSKFARKNFYENYCVSLYVHTTTKDHQSSVSQSSQSPDLDDNDGSDTISKAMQSYLQRAKEHQEFMDREEKEFVFGRRHLANMMGKDPETFSQSDIDEAIRYLFPSGLYSPKARPMMKPPQEIHPKQKAAQFNADGRPHHPFFYTSKPGFYYLLHEMVAKLNKLNETAGGFISRDVEVDTDLAGSTWIRKSTLEKKLFEKISDKEYEEWVACMERIAAHPGRDRELEFIKSYRRSIVDSSKQEELPPVTLEPDGRQSCFIPVAMKKTARGEVKVTIPGSGLFNINGKGLEYFKLIQSRENVLSPMMLCGWLGKADVDAYVTGGTEFCEHMDHAGESSRAACVRWGIATAMAALGADKERLRVAGLLIRDSRQKERKKCGRDGARAKWTWKKR